MFSIGVPEYEPHSDVNLIFTFFVLPSGNSILIVWEENFELVLDCERCGGKLIKVSEGNYICDHCGYTKIIETASSSEVVAILNSANTLRNKGEFDDAYERFEEVEK